ncbi:hypothetical protein NDU88_005638 [Pleurodeles waltl]|uniref:Uncharacterized protein n=1 Tax=Pleurodeles waltl TaxID=8319 RepID=A0AAV7L1F0_PLEWA|nr:hypothetical protein NDU88_005638 [Pleurodeles waltl]
MTAVVAGPQHAAAACHTEWWVGHRHCPQGWSAERTDTSREITAGQAAGHGRRLGRRACGDSEAGDCCGLMSTTAAGEGASLEVKK